MSHGPECMICYTEIPVGSRNFEGRMYREGGTPVHKVCPKDIKGRGSVALRKRVNDMSLFELEKLQEELRK